MDVLVGTLLSLLVQSSVPMLFSVEQVLRCFRNDVTDEGLPRILQVIGKDWKPARRKDSNNHDDDCVDDLQNIEEVEEYDEAEMHETGESSNGKTDDSEAGFRFCNVLTDDEVLQVLRAITKDVDPSSDKDVDHDNEVKDSNANDGNDDNVLQGTEEAEGSTEAEMDETGENSDEMADNSKTAVSDKDASDEASNDSDEGMDDDAMFNMEADIARAFQERRGQTGSETAHSQLVLFKHRVLSLLEIYLNENPGKPQVLMIYSNLVKAFANPHTTEVNEQLVQRIWGVLQKKIFKMKDYPKGEVVQLSTLKPLLENNLRLALRPSKKKIIPANLPKKQQSSEALVAYFGTKKSRLRFGFLKEIFKRRPWIGQPLFGLLLSKCGDAKLKFRQIEALELLLEILLGSDPDAVKRILESRLAEICRLTKHLATHLPEKQSRRAEVKKFCSKVSQIVSNHGMAKSIVTTPETRCSYYWRVSIWKRQQGREQTSLKLQTQWPIMLFFLCRQC
ncbi:hypothetical protein Nepgr_000506 [Nepenthes gracilis]|uniref:Uncharacterized protein n=1 Tax=Nepenthes gracilis TaxID=150966 RepID=A0AAD3RVH8_NEPGR|nr:hypothetical protein Nepgr_000506 [Nepenthes gracilis]